MKRTGGGGSNLPGLGVGFAQPRSYTGLVNPVAIIQQRQPSVQQSCQSQRSKLGDAPDGAPFCELKVCKARRTACCSGGDRASSPAPGLRMVLHASNCCFSSAMSSGVTPLPLADRPVQCCSTARAASRAGTAGSLLQMLAQRAAPSGPANSPTNTTLLCMVSGSISVPYQRLVARLQELVRQLRNQAAGSPSLEIRISHMDAASNVAVGGVESECDRPQTSALSRTRLDAKVVNIFLQNEDDNSALHFSR